MGLQLNPTKTTIGHTLTEDEGQAGFDFLGFNVRQYHAGRYKTRTYRGQAGFPGQAARTGKTLIRPSQKAQIRHLAHLKQVIRDYRGSSQGGLIGKLNPIIRGWVNYYKTSAATAIFNRSTAQLYYKLRRWAALRHPRKWPKWCYRRYWKRLDGLIRFTDGEHYLCQYEHTKIKRHTKVIGSKSPFDGDWLYWAQRLQQHPLKPLRVVKLLKWQRGKCEDCGLPFTTEDVLEVHHIVTGNFHAEFWRGSGAGD
jgi:RNA-directed DNA polymerase